MGKEDINNKSEKLQQYESLIELRGRLEGDSSNNPEAQRSRINDLNEQIKVLEKELKVGGELMMSDDEKTGFELDSLYPDAKSKTIVEHQGKRYQIKYFPAQSSRSRKTIQVWGHKWELIG